MPVQQATAMKKPGNQAKPDFSTEQAQIIAAIATMTRIIVMTVFFIILLFILRDEQDSNLLPLAHGLLIVHR